MMHGVFQNPGIDTSTPGTLYGTSSMLRFAMSLGLKQSIGPRGWSLPALLLQHSNEIPKAGVVLKETRERLLHQEAGVEADGDHHQKNHPDWTDCGYWFWLTKGGEWSWHRLSSHPAKRIIKSWLYIRCPTVSTCRVDMKTSISTCMQRSGWPSNSPP